ncbi:hypothetical protein BDA99DRAFT_532811 [Phascolomyces articulosus]|uniref:Galactose oxidase n=1 Tax=Phascolomyces articulosus TaxID=60185 RepID=A0AAD5KAE6_9FUNG|nr:hypothetical protein BDA99DRAFT_532811 [Phascolomyces articulosus]
MTSSRKAFLSNMVIPATRAMVLSLLLLVMGLQTINAYIPDQRTDAVCVFMATSASIFCYGGQSLRSTDSPDVQAIVGDIFIKLDLSKDMSAVEIQSAWEQVNADTGANFYFAFEAVPNQNMIFMDGGRGASSQGQTLARHNSTFYNGESESWSTDTPARGPMVQTHTATLGNDNNTIYVWGGYGSINTGLPSGTEVHPLEMYMFDIKGSKWNTGNAVGSLEESRYYHQAVRVDSSIYFIGGRYPVTGNISAARSASMDNIPLFDTDSGQWSTQATTGPTPSPRIRHTATLIPSTGQIVLLGGQAPLNTSIIRHDYFYILDTKNMMWSNTTIREEGLRFNGTGIRGHSSVLVGNNLFILFGRSGDVNMDLTSTRVWVLNVNRWTWVSSVDAVKPQPLKPGNSVGSNDSSGGGSKTGAIAGAVVGVVIGLSIIAAAFFFIRRRQKSNNENKYKSNNNDTSFMMDVPPNYYDQGENQKISNIRTIVYTTQLLGNEPPHSFDNSPENTTTIQDTPTSFHGTEKPDVSMASSSSDNAKVHRIVLPVKPDGA